MTESEKRIRNNAYAKGYMAGRNKAWPDWDPPHPPQEQVAALFKAANDLREAAFGLLQVIEADDGPDGPFVTLQRAAGNVDIAFSQVGQWLKNNPASTRTTVNKENP